jgi:hypothetical protein
MRNMRILEKELVIVFDGLDAKTVKDLHMIPAKSVEEALELAFKRHGRDARILVTPSWNKDTSLSLGFLSEYRLETAMQHVTVGSLLGYMLTTTKRNCLKW